MAVRRVREDDVLIAEQRLVFLHLGDATRHVALQLIFAPEVVQIVAEENDQVIAREDFVLPLCLVGGVAQNREVRLGLQRKPCGAQVAGHELGRLFARSRLVT